MRSGPATTGFRQCMIVTRLFASYLSVLDYSGSGEARDNERRTRCHEPGDSGPCYSIVVVVEKMKNQVIDAFVAEFGGPPSIVVRAPGRVNLIGEHTDYNDGFVLPMAIERAVWIALRPRADGRLLLHSLEQTEPADFSLTDIVYSGAGWAEYVKGMAAMLQSAGYRLSGWEGVLTSDVPVGAGLSSSAALEIAVAKAFAEVSGFTFDSVEMARLGQKTENEWVGAQTGIMDQMIAANAEAGHALLIDCRDLSFETTPLPADTAVLVFDSMTRHSHTESGYNERRASCELAAAYFGESHLRDVTPARLEADGAGLDPVAYRRARHVVTENERVLRTVEAMRAGDARTVGLLMNASHESMRDDFEITTDALDLLAELAQVEPACYGARMTGGGFGGCVIALVEANEAEAIAASVAPVYEAATGFTPQVYITAAAGGASTELAPHLKE